MNVTEGVLVEPRPSRWASLVRLALADSWSMLRHPLMLVALVLTELATFSQSYDGPRPAFSAITATQGICFGVLAFFAAHLVAGAGGRAGAEELLAPVPIGRATRTGALCLAAIGPFAVACLLQAEALGVFVATGVELPRLPTVWELGAGPLCVLGACLLGVAVARWTALPGMPLMVMIGLVSFGLLVNDRLDSVHLLGFNPEVVLWGPEPYLKVEGFIPGSMPWHAAYLLSLSLGAAALAILHDSPHRRLWLGIGTALLLAAVTSGYLSLP